MNDAEEQGRRSAAFGELYCVSPSMRSAGASVLDAEFESRGFGLSAESLGEIASAVYVAMVRGSRIADANPNLGQRARPAETLRGFKK